MKILPLVTGRSAVLLMLAVALSRPGVSAAEVTNCTAIASLPAVISTAGVHCLTKNLTSSLAAGNAIEIATSNVVLDLNGFRLAGNAGPGTGAFGIHANDRQNITIRNGTIRGFRQGIVLEGTSSRGHLVEDIRADANFEVGMQVNGSGVIVRRNHILNTGGTTFLGPNALTYGIYTAGSGVRILDNDIAKVTKVGTGYGIGIYVFSMTQGMFVDNRIGDVDVGVTGSGEFKCRDNIVFSTLAAYAGCVDAGNNH